jgi:hypothetical protein
MGVPPMLVAGNKKTAAKPVFFSPDAHVTFGFVKSLLNAASASITASGSEDFLRSAVR